jgi:hypothetical protein
LLWLRRRTACRASAHWFSRAPGFIAGHAQDLGSPGEAVVPRTSHAWAGLGISAELLLALRRATATFLEPQQAHRRP